MVQLSKLLGAVALALGTVAAPAATLAAGPPTPAFGLTPFEFVGTAAQCGGPAGTDTVTAKWDDTTGNPAPSIFLEKTGPQENCAAAGIDITDPSVEGGPAGNINELN